MLDSCIADTVLWNCNVSIDFIVRVRWLLTDGLGSVVYVPVRAAGIRSFLGIDTDIGLLSVSVYIITGRELLRDTAATAVRAIDKIETLIAVDTAIKYLDTGCSVRQGQ